MSPLPDLGSIDAGHDAAGPTSSQTPGKQKRNWAARSRNGCLTCRTRHVKCDEARPSCRRCAAGRYFCRGYGLIATRRAGISADTANESDLLAGDAAFLTNDGSEQWLERRICVEAEPPDWDHMQAIRYYFTIIRPARGAVNGEIPDPKFNTVDFPPAYAIGGVISTQLMNAGKSLGKLLRPGEGTHLASLWAKYFYYLLEIIKLANAGIRGGTHREEDQTFSAMYFLTEFDVEARSLIWLSHINGCLAYVQHLGGAAALLRRPQGIPLYFSRLISKAIMFNTLIPARQQILGYASYTDNELRALLEREFDVTVPCPPEVCLVIIHITRLRYNIATSADPPAAEPTAHALFAQLEAADIYSWYQNTNGFGSVIMESLGQIFQVAARLYGILTLPRSVLPSWAQLATPRHTADLHPYTTARREGRHKLLEMLRAVFPLLMYTHAITWPLLVAGVAVVDGAKADQGFIATCLLKASQNPNVGVALLLCRQKLHDFWLSDKTGWEDCFDEPMAF